MNLQKFTPTQTRLINVLQDGMPHERGDLLSAVGDSEVTLGNVANHFTNMRKILHPQGYEIICQYKNGKYMYRLIRRMANANDGKY